MASIAIKKAIESMESQIKTWKAKVSRLELNDDPNDEAVNAQAELLQECIYDLTELVNRIKVDNSTDQRRKQHAD